MPVYYMQLRLAVVFVIDNSFFYFIVPVIYVHFWLWLVVFFCLSLVGCYLGHFNTFTAKIDHSRFNNSCLRLPVSTLVDLIFQSHSFSLGGKIVQQLQYI
jgi:hypothetical protein